MSNDSILDVYIYETSSLLEQLETIILDSEKINTFTQEHVDEIFRIMHTIKGSSAMMEFDALASFSHRIEDLFFIVREETMDVVTGENRPALFDLMFQAVDFFRTELEKVKNNQPLNNNIDSFLQNVNSLIQRIKGEEPTPAAAPAPAAAAAAAPVEPVVPENTAAVQVSTEGNPDFPYAIRVFFDEGCGMENLRSFMLVTSVSDFCAETDFTFDPPTVENDISTAELVIEHGFLLMFKRAEDREKAIPVIRSAGSVKSYQAINCEAAVQAEIAAEAEKAAADPTSAQSAANPAANPAAAAAAAAATQQHQKESLISVNLSKLDQLSALVGEIVITEAMVTASPDLKNVPKLDAFTKSARQLRKLTDELQDVSMSLRMIPVSNTFQKMNRVVRDMSKKLNKRAVLTLIGEDTEVDKTIVDSIGDPIMHMIRNSMDHGIESSEAERIAAGKDPVGHVTLSAQDTGSEVIIIIQDDGQGVNYEKVLKKAIKAGLASPDAEYSNKEILNFLMMPGISTNNEVTEYSGRGVGMDVVKSSVEALGGSVNIESVPGHGMTTTMRIPLTMAIMDGMEVSVGDSIFTIPINNILQSLKVSSSDILHDSVNGEMIKIMDNYYPIIRAKEHYNLPNGYDDVESGILMWLDSGNYTYCLFVDELLGEQQIVVKPMPSYVNSFDIKTRGIAGCSILGDGNISIILDAGNLYTSAQRV